MGNGHEPILRRRSRGRNPVETTAAQPAAHAAAIPASNALSVTLTVAEHEALVERVVTRVLAATMPAAPDVPVPSRETASRLGVHVSTLERYRALGLIRPVPGSKRPYRYMPSEIRRFLAGEAP